MEAAFCVEALGGRGRHGWPEIFNADQGFQLTSHAFTGVPLQAAIAVSMEGNGSWRDNVFVERLWRPISYGGGLSQGLRHRQRRTRVDQPLPGLQKWPAAPFAP